MAKSARGASKDHPLANAPVINPAQLGGIETSVLDDGPGRGLRIAWVNTGGGFRYKVMIDRGLDIADAEFLGQSLTWHSLGGPLVPSHAYTHGMEWLWGFYGGLLVSCGPLNTGSPFVEDGKDYGLHGTHSYSRAIVESIVNPDPARGQYEMSITGIVRTARLFGPNVELRRTISSTLGTPVVRVHDAFLNRGNEPVPHAWLLHINFGYPLLEPGASTYCYQGTVDTRLDSAGWFAPGRDFRAAVESQESHRGIGEAFAYINPKPDAKGMVLAGVVNRKRGFGVKIEYPAKEFARMGNWQHWGPAGEYVGALEPMTAGVEGRAVDRERGWFRSLKPGQKAEYHCTITATNDKAVLEQLLRLNR